LVGPKTWTIEYASPFCEIRDHAVSNARAAIETALNSEAFQYQRQHSGTGHDNLRSTRSYPGDRLPASQILLRQAIE
jgi:hypothetical protein